MKANEFYKSVVCFVNGKQIAFVLHPAMVFIVQQLPILRKNVSLYQSDEHDSGFPSCSTSSCYGSLENELRNEIIRSDKRRSALADSLKNAYHAMEYQKNCLAQQERDITSSTLTLDSLLIRQELLDSRIYNLKRENFCPDVLSMGVSKKKAQQSSGYLSEVTDNNRINTLEREMNDIKEKMRSYGSLWTRNVETRNVYEDGKCDEADPLEIYEGLRQHSELMEAKCSRAQEERDVLELQVSSLHSGLHQEKVTSKRLEKETVKLQSQIAANRNINESLHLEVSALKQHNHTLANAAEGSESKNKSLHVQVESLQKEKQVLASQKELLCEIMKKKGKWKSPSGNLTRRTPELIQTNGNSERSYVSCSGRNSCSELTQAATSEYCRKRRDGKDKKCDSKDQKRSHSNAHQPHCDRKFVRKEKYHNRRRKEAHNPEENELTIKDGDSPGHDTHRRARKTSELSGDIIAARCQHLADLLSELECLKMNNVRLDNEKEQILKFLLRAIKEFQDCKINSESSREQVEELLNERVDLSNNSHKRINQITAVIIELKHLRQAYNGLLRHSQDPDDKKAIQWISRVQAIKDSLKRLQEEENVNPLLLM